LEKSVALSVFHVLKSQTIELRHVIIVESVKDLAPIFATAHQAQLAQSTQLVGHGGFGHFELGGKLTHIHFAFE
jgi:hypothetical protein